VIEDSGLWQIRDEDGDDYDYEERATLNSDITELDVLMSRIEDSSPGQGGSYEVGYSYYLYNVVTDYYAGSSIAF
jgi:hypothetical protein